MLNQALGLTMTRIALGMILFAHGYFLQKSKPSRSKAPSDFLRVLDFPLSLHTW